MAVRKRLSKRTLEDLSLLMRATKADGVFVDDWDVAGGRVDVKIRTRGGFHHVTLKGHAVHCILSRLWTEAQKELRRRLRADLESVMDVLGIEG